MASNETLMTIMVTIVCSVVASSGFWAFVQHCWSKNDATTRLLIGIAHDRIMALGTHYIHRGSITPDEYENLRKYLYEPYHEAGGNGTASKIMMEVDKLPIRSAESDDFNAIL